jgi:hypothetical protein
VWWQGVLGLALVAVCWPLNWGLPGMRTAALFFPLWLGFILAMDAAVRMRRGHSLLAPRSGGAWPTFVASVPVWCLFEFVNARTQNWEYVGERELAPAAFVISGVLSFSTVMPAIFVSAEWVRSCRWMDRFATGPRLVPTRRLAGCGLGVGTAMLGLIWLWPEVFYSLMWSAWYCLFESVNILGRRPTLLEFTARGDWRPVVALAVGALGCGLLWELWNFYASPKWVYHTPGVEFWHVFEMPLLGYLGYIPFAWELFALKNFLFPRHPAPEL